MLTIHTDITMQLLGIWSSVHNSANFTREVGVPPNEAPQMCIYTNSALYNILAVITVYKIPLAIQHTHNIILLNTIWKMLCLHKEIWYSYFVFHICMDYIKSQYKVPLLSMEYMCMLYNHVVAMYSLFMPAGHTNCCDIRCC